VRINPLTRLPEKIEVFENNGGKKEILFDQNNPSVTYGPDFKKLQNQIIEPITMAAIFRCFNLLSGTARFFFGNQGDLFTFDLSQKEKIKTAGGEILKFVSNPPKITIYLSDEVKKIPVGLVYDLFVGRLELRLKKYSEE
jgi:hypothetical protein